MDNIQFFNRYTNKLEIENVYGGKWVRWMYENPVGKALSEMAAKPFISKIYGNLQDSPSSKKKVKPFIKDFSIQIDEFLPQEGREVSDPYESFNQFFIRKFKDGKRPFAKGDEFPAPCEARYFGFNQNTEDISLPVKGAFLKPKDLLGNAGSSFFKNFENGPVVVARLCPVDYHRFHYPDDGKILKHYPETGKLHSVNPIALKSRADIFITNERYVSILETENFGKIAYIEVGATCVGKIYQSHNLDSDYNRGDEKGYFLFGGSTVVLLGEPGFWELSQDLKENSLNGTETYIRLGDTIGKKIL